MIDAAETVPTSRDLPPVTVDVANIAVQLSESADVFWLPRRAGRIGKGISYRRFETLAEAVKFAVESISSAADVRIYTERGPVAQGDFRVLYDAAALRPVEDE